MQNINYQSSNKKEAYNNIKRNRASIPDNFSTPDFKPKRKTRKKPNPIAVLAALFIWGTALFLATGVNKTNFLEPVYLNRINNKHLNFDPHMIYAPTLNYANNLNLMGENLLAPIPPKGKKEIVQINPAGELTGLKKYLEGILSEYKNLHAGIYIYDYGSKKSVEINSNEVFPAASIIKIPVLLDLFNRSKNLEKEGYAPVDLNKKMTFTEAHRTEGSGNLQFKSANVDYTLDYLAKIMIRSSDNSATNMLIEEVGGINQLNASLRHWGFSKTQVSNWLPDLKGTNTTTPFDIATMLYNIDNRKFLTTASSANIKEYMSKVENRTLIRSQVPDDVILMHKTGDIGKMLGDAGIIFTPAGKKFILVIMVKRPHNDYGARELIQKVSKAVYNTLG